MSREKKESSSGKEDEGIGNENCKSRCFFLFFNSKKINKGTSIIKLGGKEETLTSALPRLLLYHRIVFHSFFFVALFREQSYF